jgi:hypothetical protein
MVINYANIPLDIEGRYVLYSPAVEMYLRVKTVTPSAFAISWAELDVSTSFTEYHVNRIMETYECRLTGCFGCSKQNITHAEVDIQVSKSFTQLLHTGMISSVREILLVPVECEYVDNRVVIKGVDFVLAESLL